MADVDYYNPAKRKHRSNIGPTLDRCVVFAGKSAIYFVACYAVFNEKKIK